MNGIKDQRLLLPALSIQHTASDYLFSPKTFIVFIPRAVVLSQGQFCPPGDICQCLETFVIVTSGGGEVLLAPSTQRPRMLLNRPQYTGHLTTRGYLVKTSVVLSLKNCSRRTETFEARPNVWNSLNEHKCVKLSISIGR